MSPDLGKIEMQWPFCWQKTHDSFGCTKLSLKDVYKSDMKRCSIDTDHVSALVASVLSGGSLSGRVQCLQKMHGDLPPFKR